MNDEPPFTAQDYEPPRAIRATPFVWREPGTIPPRQWIYGRHLIRKYLSTTIAAGGVGKSSLLLAEAVCLASGRNLLDTLVQRKFRVWYWNGEDPLDEVERRVAALCIHYKITRSDLDGYLFVNSGRVDTIVIATMTRDGAQIAIPVKDALISTITENCIDVVIIDPLVSSHSVTENDNMAIDLVCKQGYGKIAEACNCSFDLVHHVRKNGGGEISIEDGRGAISLIQASRSARVLNVMTRDEASRARVEKPREFFRADNGKANLAPPPDKSDWYRLVSVPLGNGDADYPFGDHIQVVTPWQWPSALEGVTVSDLRAAQTAVADGKWRKDVQSPDWVGIAIAGALKLDADNPADKEKIKSLLKTWIANKMFVEALDRDDKGKMRPFVRVGTWATD